MSTLKHYVLEISGAIEPAHHGPYDSEEKQIEVAHEIDLEQNRDCDALVWIDVDLATGKINSGTFAFGEARQKIG